MEVSARIGASAVREKRAGGVSSGVRCWREEKVREQGEVKGFIVPSVFFWVERRRCRIWTGVTREGV